jgi:putative membrane protein
LTAAINALSETIGSLERIRNTPIPLAYSIHLKHIILIYHLAMPFQIIGTVGWGTIPFMMVTAFVICGIEGIGVEIENPVVRYILLEGFLPHFFDI